MRPEDLGIGKLFEKIRDAVIVADAQTQRVVAWNSAATEMFGYRISEAQGLHLEELVPEHLKAQHREGLARYAKTGHGPYVDSHGVLELPALTKGGEEISVEMSLSPVGPEWDGNGGGGRLVLAIVRNVTERTRAEEELKESEERFRLLVEAVRDYAIFRLDSEGRVASWNEGARRINGYDKQEILGRHFSVFYTEGDVERDHPEEELRIAAAEGSYEEEGLRVRKDGSRFNASVLITALRDEDGQLVGFSKVTRDITERKRAQELIKRQANLLEQTHDAVFMWELDGTIVYWNRGAERLYGWSEEEALGRISHELLKTVHPLPLQELESKLQAAGHWEGELVHHARDGRRILVESRHVLGLYTGESELVLETNRDITERKRADEEIHYLNETLGELKTLVGKLVAAQEEEHRRVAYEVNEGLAQVAAAAHLHLQAFSEQFSGSPGSKSDLEWAMKLVRQTVSDAQKITTSLRPPELDDFGLAAAVYSEVERLREEGYDVEYEQGLGDERLPLLVESTLFRVAQEALANVREHAETQRVRIELRRRKDEARLEVRDYGGGFAPHAPSAGGDPVKRFDLSGLRERVALLGGELKVHTSPGTGTSLVATVPLAGA